MEYRETLVRVLKKKGYRVVVNAEVEGESGVVHKIPILVVLGEKKYIGFDIAEGKDVEKTIIKCFVKVIDVPEIQFYLIIERRIFREILGDLYSSRIVVFDSLEDLLAKIEEIISREAKKSAISSKPVE